MIVARFSDVVRSKKRPALLVRGAGLRCLVFRPLSAASPPEPGGHGDNGRHHAEPPANAESRARGAVGGQRGNVTMHHTSFGMGSHLWQERRCTSTGFR